MKAELMGDTDLASELQAKLDSARKLRETQGQIPAKPDREVSGKIFSFLCTNVICMIQVAAELENIRCTQEQ